jgi:hypothetical protein
MHTHDYALPNHALGCGARTCLVVLDASPTTENYFFLFPANRFNLGMKFGLGKDMCVYAVVSGLAPKCFGILLFCGVRRDEFYKLNFAQGYINKKGGREEKKENI